MAQRLRPERSPSMERDSDFEFASSSRDTERGIDLCKYRIRVNKSDLLNELRSKMDINRNLAYKFE